MKPSAAKAAPQPAVLSLAQLLTEQPAAPPPGWIEPGLLPPSGILFVGGEPKVGKSLLVANLALALAAGKERAGFTIPAARRVLVCQFELPTPQFVGRLATMRRSVGPAADQNLLVDTRAGVNLLSAPQGLNHFLKAARQAAAEVIVLDPLYSAHDQDENDTRSMAALCQSLLRLRDASQAALIVVHHVRKSIGREEIGSAFRGSSALHAVGDSYLLLTRPSAQLAATIELRFQFRYAAPPQPRLLQLDPQTLCFSAAGAAPSQAAAARKKVEQEHVTQALAGLDGRLAITNSASKSWSKLSVPNARPNWPSAKPAAKVRSFKLTANTGYRCSAGGRSEVRSGSRPGGCPGPMRRSWLRRNRLTRALPRFPNRAREGSLRSDRENKKLHFFGEIPERRPWAIKREDAPGRLRRALPN